LQDRCERERERERALLGTTVHNGGSRAGGARSTDSTSPHAIQLPHLQPWGSILHGKDIPRTLMRSSPDCAVDHAMSMGEKRRDPASERKRVLH